MNIRARLNKLEDAAGTNKPLFEMSDAEIERFIGQSLGLPAGTPITDDMLRQIVNDGKNAISSMTHDEVFDRLESKEETRQ